jgi:hypothetical protein
MGSGMPTSPEQRQTSPATSVNCLSAFHLLSSKLVPAHVSTVEFILRNFPRKLAETGLAHAPDPIEGGQQMPAPQCPGGHGLQNLPQYLLFSIPIGKQLQSVGLLRVGCVSRHGIRMVYSGIRDMEYRFRNQKPAE